MAEDKLKLDVLVSSDLNSWMSMPYKKKYSFEKRMARAIIREFRRVGVDCKVLAISLQLGDNQTLACCESFKYCCNLTGKICELATDIQVSEEENNEQTTII